jgi:hypothetical protein
LQQEQSWWIYSQKNEDTIRPSIKDNIIKILSCGNTVVGYKTYVCSNPDCIHTKIIPFSCKSRFCPTCGKAATDRWIQTQKNILPKTRWQHITLTMPGQLWDFFADYRELLNKLPKIAANIIIKLAGKRKVKVGMFIALHTFGHDLKWNVHIHLSVTMGGLTEKQTWKKIRFSKKAVMPMWKYEVINLLRKHAKDGNIKTSNKFLNQEYKKNWIIHLAKPTKSAWRTIDYLGRYLKRPPLALSKLLHYDGKQVIFNFIDRNDNSKRTTRMEIDIFLDKFTQHIPDKGFRMIRYYGFLANAVRGKFLPIVYKLLNQNVTKEPTLGWRVLMKKTFNVDPLQCILCGYDLACIGIDFGMTQSELRLHHYELANAKIIDY